MIILSTQSLSKTYGEGDAAVQAVKPCDLHITQGDSVAIVGASGSGKSTLLHLLGGLDAPTGGKVLYGEEKNDLYALPDDELSAFRCRRVGFVFQSYNLIPEMTAAENIRLPALLSGQTPDEAYLKQVEDELGLAGRLSHYPGELSGGQQQRVAIARALCNRPELLLCDEPTGNLDTQTGQEVIALLQREAEAFGITLLLVTHDATVAQTARRIITIQDGVVGGDPA